MGVGAENRVTKENDWEWYIIGKEKRLHDLNQCHFHLHVFLVLLTDQHRGAPASSPIQGSSAGILNFYIKLSFRVFF